MDDYNTNIVITSVMKSSFKDEKTHNITDMTKVDLLLTDEKLCGVNDKFVGCVPVTQWYQGHDVFDTIIKNGLILKGCNGHFITKQDYKNRTKFSSKLESITYKDNVITLL